MLTVCVLQAGRVAARYGFDRSRLEPEILTACAEAYRAGLAAAPPTPGPLDATNPSDVERAYRERFRPEAAVAVRDTLFRVTVGVPPIGKADADRYRNHHFLIWPPAGTPINNLVLPEDAPDAYALAAVAGTMGGSLIGAGGVSMEDVLRAQDRIKAAAADVVALRPAVLTVGLQLGDRPEEPSAAVGFIAHFAQAILRAVP